jgi:hypothetical protein
MRPVRRICGMGLMDMVGGLAGGGLGDMLKKVEAGQHEQIGGDEAASAFSHVAGKLPQGELQQVAQNAVSKMSPSQQQELSKTLAQHAGGQAPQGSGGIAGVLTQLAGGGNLGALAQNPVAKMAMASIAAFAMKRLGGSAAAGSAR